jgi:cytochrome c biogenesis protein CcdA/thiol-disulfide isomerase/thioredoxin
MFLLVGFAFIAGFVTVLSPCILPVLPIVLSTGLTGGRRRPFGIVIGFVASFTFFTLALATLVKWTGVSADALRTFSILIIALFGLTLLVPRFQVWMEGLFSRISTFAPKANPNAGFFGGLLIGLSLGLLWTPCVGPILASVITLAASSNVSLSAILITLSYSLGTSIPMLLIILGGRALLNRVPWLLRNSGNIQKAFGILMVLLAIGLYFNADRSFEIYILEKFPQYGSGLTQLENNPSVNEQLGKLNSSKSTIPLPTTLPNQYPSAPDLIPGGQWFNTKPLTMAELRGKVVLVDFWTYTCINCIRTLPYVKSWHAKYADKGLVIIGVHAPEFEFEKNADNVQRALKDFGILYPVMQDNNLETWNAYHNQYWPADYLIDKDGKIRSTHFGEGDYDQTEMELQKLLAEAGADVSNLPVKNPTYAIRALTPETYLGYGRLGNFSSPEGVQPDQSATYSIPKDLSSDSFAYGGQWTVTSERAMPVAKDSLEFRFNASGVYLVMRPKTGSVSGTLNVTLDGKPISAGDAGEDVSSGVVTVEEDRLYRLVKLKDPGEHVLKLEFQDSNLELYAFTFG